MNAVDVKCPICEKLNKLLNLEETTNTYISDE